MGMKWQEYPSWMPTLKFLRWNSNVVATCPSMATSNGDLSWVLLSPWRPNGDQVATLPTLEFLRWNSYVVAICKCRSPWRPQMATMKCFAISSVAMALKWRPNGDLLMTWRILCRHGTHVATSLCLSGENALFLPIREPFYTQVLIFILNALET